MKKILFTLILALLSVTATEAQLIKKSQERENAKEETYAAGKVPVINGKVTFETAEDITVGLAIDAKLTGSVEDGAKVSADYAAVVLAGGKVVASMLDSAEASYTFEYDTDAEKYNVTAAYNGTKNEQGDAYDSYAPMASGRWYAQAQAFANTSVGKTTAELENLSTEKIEGSCSIYTGGYKAVIVRAAGYAR